MARRPSQRSGRAGDGKAPVAPDLHLLVTGGGPLGDRLHAALGAGWRHETSPGVPPLLAAAGLVGAARAGSPRAGSPRGEPGRAARPQSVVYLAASRGRRGRPDAGDAGALLAACAAAGVPRVVVVASTAVHEPSHLHPGMVAEEAVRNRRTGNPAAAAWRAFEAAVEDATQAAARAGRASRPAAFHVTLLRAAPLPVPGGDDLWSRLLFARVAPTVLGFDPMVQLLAVDDLAAAVAAVLRRPAPVPDGGGVDVFHVVPREPAPARRAVRSAGARRVALPASLWRLARPGSEAAGERAALRFPATASGRRLAAATGFTARWTTLEAARRNRGEEPPPSPACDEQGFDPAYRRRLGRTLFRFLERVYWRVEVHGIEHVPRHGRALLVGTHRGFQPWDGVMIQQAVLRHTGRAARFLMHPTLVKFAFFAPYMTKIGGLVGSRENAGEVLSRGGLLGVYPEGIRGAFTRLADAYRISPFFRDDFAELAIRHQAPIVPFVTLGSAESFPIVGRLDWDWARRRTQWPYVPVTTPLPLPSKWHTLVLPPVETAGRFRPEEAGDPEAVRRLAGEVRDLLAAALERGGRRRRRFFGRLPESG